VKVCFTFHHCTQTGHTHLEGDQKVERCLEFRAYNRTRSKRCVPKKETKMYIFIINFFIKKRTDISITVNIKRCTVCAPKGSSFLSQLPVPHYCRFFFFFSHSQQTLFLQIFVTCFVHHIASRIFEFFLVRTVKKICLYIHF
jgi:hypothetical protein